MNVFILIMIPILTGILGYCICYRKVKTKNKEIDFYVNKLSRVGIELGTAKTNLHRMQNK